MDTHCLSLPKNADTQITQDNKKHGIQKGQNKPKAKPLRQHKKQECVRRIATLNTAQTLLTSALDNFHEFCIYNL